MALMAMREASPSPSVPPGLHAQLEYLRSHSPIPLKVLSPFLSPFLSLTHAQSHTSFLIRVRSLEPEPNVLSGFAPARRFCHQGRMPSDLKISPAITRFCKIQSPLIVHNKLMRALGFWGKSSDLSLRHQCLLVWWNWIGCRIGCCRVRPNLNAHSKSTGESGQI
jgi:hypothetical protein